MRRQCEISPILPSKPEIPMRRKTDQDNFKTTYVIWSRETLKFHGALLRYRNEEEDDDDDDDDEGEGEESGIIQRETLLPETRWTEIIQRETSR